MRPLLADPVVTDVFVNGDGRVVVDRGNGRSDAGLEPLSAPLARSLAVGLIGLGGRHIDEASPCVDVRLADGVRVHAVLPPISTGGALLSIRAPRVERLTLSTLETAGTFTAISRDTLVGLIRRRANILLTGAAGSGKTTLLAALLAEADVGDRIITLEDVAELRIDHPQVVSLESRQANLEGAGALDLSRLVREALRMNPTRLVVGECRGPELRELLTALTTGHDGGAGTLHANGLEAVPARLEALGALAGLPVEALGRQAAAAFDVVIHLAGRRVVELGRLAIDDAGRLRALPFEGASRYA